MYAILLEPSTQILAHHGIAIFCGVDSSSLRIIFNTSIFAGRTFELLSGVVLAEVELHRQRSPLIHSPSHGYLQGWSGRRRLLAELGPVLFSSRKQRGEQDAA